MVSILTKGWAAFALAANSTTAIAADPASPVRSVASTATKHLAHSRLDLTDGTIAVAPVVKSRTPAPARRPRSGQFGNGKTATIEGPSWSYQTSRRGPTFEMGALGGGAMENAPFLAHVAMAWQF